MQGVIFDFNGTLFFDNDKHVKAWSRIARELRGTPITEEELHTHMNGKPNIEIVRYLTNGKATPEEADRLSKLKEKYYREACVEDLPSFHLVEGAEKLFDDLKAEGVPFTIASASIKDNIDFFVESFHLDQWIKPENIVYDDGSYKDKVAMFQKASRILNVPLAKMTVIEDSLAGINSSIKAGVQDIRLMDSGNIYDEVKDLSQIRQVVMNMNEIER